MKRHTLAIALALAGCRGNWATPEDIADLQAQIDALSSDLAAANGSNSEDQARITELEGQLADATARLDTLEVSVGDILNDTDFSSFADRVGDVEDALDAQDAAITDLESAQVTTDNAIALLETGVSASAEVNATQDGAIASTASDVAALNTRTTAAESGITGLTTSLAGTNAAVATLSSSMASAQTDLDALETNFTSLSTTVTDLGTDLTDLTTRVTTAEGTISTHTTDLAALDARLDAHDITLASHTTDLTTLDSRVDTHDTTLASQSSTLASHTGSLSTLSATLGTLNSTVSTQGSTLASQGTTLSGHTSQIATLNSTVGSQGVTLSGHTATLASYGTRLNGLDTFTTAINTDVTNLEVDMATVLRRTTVFRNTFTSNEEQDNGLIPNRTLSFTKVSAASTLRMTYYDNLRVWNGGSGGQACMWEVLINGVSCANPGALTAQNHVGYSSHNTHRDGGIEGICRGIPAGTVNVTVRVTPQPGYVGPDCYTGWNTQRGYLEAIEID